MVVINTRKKISVKKYFNFFKKVKKLISFNAKSVRSFFRENAVLELILLFYEGNRFRAGNKIMIKFISRSPSIKKAGPF